MSSILGALTLPNAEDCANRIKQAKFGEHNYFFSWEYEATKDLKVEIYPIQALLYTIGCF